VRRIVTWDRRRGHIRKKTKQHWTSARGRLELGGQDVTHPPGTEDRRKEVAAEVEAQATVVVEVEVESCKTGDLRRTFSMSDGFTFTLRV
jgi:hypothetical protein